MASETATHPAAAEKNLGFMALIYAAQFFYGGWFVFHGANYFLRFFPQPAGSSVIAHEVISALIDSGLFSIVKAIEVITGLAFLANRAVPLAAVAAFPVTFSIAYINYVADGGTFSVCTAIAVVGLNGLIALGHLDKFLPMLAINQGDPDLGRIRAALTKYFA